MYIIYDYDPSPNGFKFTHDPYTVTTSPFAHSLCGNIHYNAYLEGQLLTASSSPMSYDTLNREFEIYSQNFNLIGYHTLEIQAYFEDYPVMTSVLPNEETEIFMEDPCKRPFGLQALPQKNPENYYYTEDGTTFTVTPLIIDPSVCQITYSCISVDGPDSDVRCEDKNIVNFSRSTGTTVIRTLDVKKYSPGTYTFNLRGTAGTVVPLTADFSFKVTLIDPCPQAQLAILNHHPFENMEYILGRESIY